MVLGELEFGKGERSERIVTAEKPCYTFGRDTAVRPGGAGKREKAGGHMKSILHEQRLSSVGAALVTILLGGVLVWWPDRSIQFLCMLLGVSIFATGVIYILGWLARRKKGVPAFFVIPGVILGALGVWLMTSPDSVIMLIQYMFGAILIFHGIVDLQGVAALAQHRWDRWWIDLLLTTLTLVFGVLVLFNPFGTFAALVVLIGIALIYDGLSDLCIIFRLSRAYAAAARQAEEAERLEQLAQAEQTQPAQEPEPEA